MRSEDCYGVQTTRNKEGIIADLRLASFRKNLAQAEAAERGRQRARAPARRAARRPRLPRPRGVPDGRARWRAYQHEALRARLDHLTDVREPIVADDNPRPSFLSEVFDMVNPLDPMQAFPQVFNRNERPSLGPSAGPSQGVIAIIRGCSFASPTPTSATPPCGCAPTCRSRDRRAYARHNGEWRLELAPPPVARLEYELEVVDHDGDAERVLRPRQPAPGARRVRRQVRAAAPRLHRAARGSTAEGVPGQTAGAGDRRAAGSARRSRSASGAPRTPDPAEPLPLLVAHDGPGVRPAGRADALRRRRHRAPARCRGTGSRCSRPGERNEWYSASARYAGALVRDVLPAIRAAVGVEGAPGRHGREPRRRWRCCTRSAAIRARSAALFLQSGSFFTPRFDSHESRFPRYQRDRALRARDAPRGGTRRPGAGRADLRIRGGERARTTG